MSLMTFSYPGSYAGVSSVAAGITGGAVGATVALLINDWAALRLMPITEAVLLPVAVHLTNRRAGRLWVAVVFSVVIAYLTLTVFMLVSGRFHPPPSVRWGMLVAGAAIQLWVVIIVERRSARKGVSCAPTACQ